MAAEAFILLVFLFFAVAGPLVLYFLIQSETDNDPVLSREEAEQAARDGYEKSK
ncbi:hypothetical protein [Haladaptatus sp. DJG-WS-42]|uniref:hypothetical protein n=1 Tax=Haladaptatus sp. DJG-WS-42 TaxID=3120516 RepID=UPI0030D53330